MRKFRHKYTGVTVEVPSELKGDWQEITPANKPIEADAADHEGPQEEAESAAVADHEGPQEEAESVAVEDHGEPQEKEKKIPEKKKTVSSSAKKVAAKTTKRPVSRIRK